MGKGAEDMGSLVHQRGFTQVYPGAMYSHGIEDFTSTFQKSAFQLAEVSNKHEVARWGRGTNVAEALSMDMEVFT